MAGFRLRRVRRAWRVFFVVLSAALVVVGVAAAGYFEVVQASGPEGYWRLGESSGTVAADASGHGHAATYVNGPTLGVSGGVIGDADTAVGLSALGQYAQAPFSAALQPSTFTVEALVNPASLVNTNGFSARPIVSSRNSATEGYMLYQDGYTGGPQFAFIIGTGAPYRWVYQASGLPLAVNTWYHVVGVWDGSLVRLYVNGVDVSGPQQGSGVFVPSPSAVFNCPASRSWQGFGLVWLDGRAC